MTDPSFIPEGDRELLAVYPTFEEARRARTAVIDAGVPEAEVHLDRDVDTVTALRAEMHEELTEGVVAPQAGVIYPREGARGLVLVSLIGVVIGVAAAFPLALIPLGSTYLTRLLIFAVVGAAFGFTIGLVVGPAGAAQRPGQPPAGARGTTVRVEHDTAELRRLLASLHPIRIDEVAHDDQPIATIVTEGGKGMTQTAKDIVANAGGDDFHPQRRSDET